MNTAYNAADVFNADDLDINGPTEMNTTETTPAGTDQSTMGDNRAKAYTLKGKVISVHQIAPRTAGTQGQMQVNIEQVSKNGKRYSFMTFIPKVSFDRVADQFAVGKEISVYGHYIKLAARAATETTRAMRERQAFDIIALSGYTGGNKALRPRAQQQQQQYAAAA